MVLAISRLPLILVVMVELDPLAQQEQLDRKAYKA
jgi:hypothetical protein